MHAESILNPLNACKINANKQLNACRIKPYPLNACRINVKSIKCSLCYNNALEKLYTEDKSIDAFIMHLWCMTNRFTVGAKQSETSIHSTRHLIALRQRLLGKVARKFASCTGAFICNYFGWKVCRYNYCIMFNKTIMTLECLASNPLRKQMFYIKTLINRGFYMFKVCNFQTWLILKIFFRSIQRIKTKADIYKAQRI